MGIRMKEVSKVYLHLDAERRRADAARRRKSSTQLWSIGLICLIVFALLDYFFVFDRPIRALFFVILAGVVVWQFARFARACRRTISRKEIAGEVEQQSGQETVVLTTAADEHVRQTSVADEVGTTLLQRLDKQAIELARSTPLQAARAVIPWRRALFATAAVCCMFALSGGWWSYSRVLMPWARLPYTRVKLDGPTERIAALSPFQLSGTLRGRLKNTALLHSSVATTATQIPVDRDGKFAINLPGIAEASSFWVSAGDGTSRRIEIQVFKPAEFAEFVIQVNPPKYAAQLAKVEDGPNFEVLRGSRLDYRVRLTEEVRSLNLLILPDGTGRITGPVPFEPTEDPLVYRLQTDKFSRDLNYRLELTHRNGDVSRNDEPFRILTMDDDPPHLTITEHNGKDVVKTGTEDVTVQLNATDDVGLASMKLVYRKIGKPGETKSVPVDGSYPLELKTKSLLELAPLELQPFDILAIHAEGQDGNTFDGPGIGKSQVVMIEVPEPPREDQAGGGGGNQGGGGGGGQTVNPLEMQKYILQDTSKLIAKSNPSQFEDLQKDQEEANFYTEQLLNNVKAQAGSNPQARGLAAQLELAFSTMKLSARQLTKTRRDQSVLAQEFAVATLTKAAQMMGGPT